MRRDERLRLILVRALITEPNRKSAGEVLEHWDAMTAALTKIKEQQPKTLEKLRRRGVIFKEIGADPLNWEHVAFSIYTDLCRVDQIAGQGLAS